MALNDDSTTTTQTDAIPTPDPSGKNVTTMTKEEAVARRSAPKASNRADSKTPKRKAIAKVNKNAKAKKSDQPKRVPFTDKQTYLIMRSNGKGTYVTVTGSESLYETAQHGYVTRVYKTNQAGDPIGANLVKNGKMKSDKIEINCPAS